MGKKLLPLFLVVFLSIISFVFAPSLFAEDAEAPKQTAPGEFTFETGNEKVKVEKNSQSDPEATLNRWGGKTFIKVSYEPDTPLNPVIEGEKLKYKGQKEELHFYNIKEGEEVEAPQQQSSVRQFLSYAFNFLTSFLPKTTSVLADEEILRYINMGGLDPAAMSASYEMFQKKADKTPTLISYTPKENTFVFYGDKQLEQDLHKDKVSFPVTRYSTQDEKACPVIYADADDTLVFTYYNPKISENPDLYINLAMDSVNQALEKYNVKLYKIRHSLFYQDGLLPKQIGRMDTDKEYLIFYIYLDSPLKTEQFISATRPYISLRDGNIVPIGGLKELNPDINSSIMDEVAASFAQKLGASFSTEQLSSEESQIMDSLKANLSSDDWTKLAKRADAETETEAPPADKFEIELILKEKPTTNIFKFNIGTEGLNFYYQPELTEEEKDRGDFRAEDIIGSYAVYFAQQEKIVKSKEEAEKYQTGKAFHIYRPKILDARGKTIWGQMHVDEEKELLTVTVPQEFLDSASYPVSVDPTFGYTTAGGSSQRYEPLSERNLWGSVFTMGAVSGTGTSMTAYLKPDNTKGTIDNNKFGIYKASDSTFLTNGATNEFEGFADIADPAAWITSDFSTPPTLTASTDYILVFWSGATGDFTYNLYYDDGTTNQGKHTVEAYGPTFPASPSFSSEDRKYSIYVTYDEDADIVAPVISSVSSSTSASSATITWTTNEIASSQVEYGTNLSYGTTTAETDTSPRVTSHSVNLPSLSSCTKYLYRVRSRDAAGNTTTGINNDFTTACISTVPPSTVAPPPSSCSDTVGAKAPSISSATPQDGNSVLLSFTPADQPVDKYILEFGIKSGEYIYGVSNLGVNSPSQMSYLVNSLAPNTKYYFRIRAGNGCVVGPWSGEISATTKGLISFNQLEITKSNLEPTAPKATPKPQATPVPTPEPEASEEVTEGYDVNVKVLDTAQIPVEGAKVTVHSKVQEAFTNKEGIASFSNVEPGEHRVIIAYENFEGEQSVNLTGDVKEFDLKVEIKRQNVLLSPTVLGIVSFLIFIIVILSVMLARRKA